MLAKAPTEQPKVSKWLWLTYRHELQNQLSDIFILADVLTKEHFDSGENAIH